MDVRDIAAVTVKALTEPGHQGQAYVLTGPEALTHDEVAAIVAQATGKRFVYEDMPPEVYRRELIAKGVSEYYAGLLLDLFAFMRRRGAAEVHDDVRKVLGRPAITFRQFAVDFSGELAKQVAG